MQPASILSYYPTYSILDEIVSYGNYNTINIFVDLKNCMQTLYMEHAIRNIVESSIQCNYPDTSIFSSIISFLSFHKKYSLSRNIKINFYVFLEKGHSYYHQNISSKYKVSRKIDDLYGLSVEERELFFKVMRKNYMLIEKACNRMPNVKIISLPNLEADFIPYYLIRNGLVYNGANVANVVYSNDHDLLQTIQLGSNIYVFQKYNKIRRIVKSHEVMKRYMKFDCDFPDNYLDFAMSIIGDSGDDVDGIKGIGGKTCAKILNETINIVGGIENLRHNVVSGKPIFDPSLTMNPNKYINKVIISEKLNKMISNNLKLVSFEVLSRFVDDPVSTSMIEKKQYILNVLQNRMIAPLSVMREALNKSRVYLEDDDLNVIYFKQ